MYISRLHLKNIRCLKEITIDFEVPGASILILGNNGDGKSTILKSLAMGLCDESSTAALFRELPGETVRRKEGQKEVTTGAHGLIEIDLIDHNDHKYQIKTKITSGKKFERISQELLELKNVDNDKEIKPHKFPWDKIFVAGYGPGIRIHATSSSQHYLAVDAVYSLFNYISPLQNPELVLRRLIAAAGNKVETYEQKGKEEAKLFKEIQLLMADLLDLESPDNFKLTNTGITVDGHWGTSELSELGDGFQALINLTLDLLSWWFLRENGKSEWNLKELNGIVIIDEIEQHLHPKWQQTIFSRLREQFPKIQFIIATHSPLVASANENVDVLLLRPGGHEIFNPFGWLAEDVYEKMGVESTRSINYKILDEYKKLRNKQVHGNISKIESRKLKQLRKKLAQLPESDPISITTDILSITQSLRELKKQGESK